MVDWSSERGSSGLNNDEVLVLVQLGLVLGLDSREGGGTFREPLFGLLTGIWEAEAPGRCRASVDELGVVPCNKAFNDSLIDGVSLYHIERDVIPDPCNLDGGWLLGKADTVVTNDVSLALLRSSLDHTADDEQSENRETTSTS